MDIEVAAEPVDFTQSSPTPPASPEAENEDSPLAAHEAAFSPQKHQPPPDPDQPVEKPRHRAQSQRAKPSDVDDIAAFTKRLREAEDAIPIARKEGESDRVYQLRRRAEIAELAKSGRQPAPAAPARVEPSVQRQPVQPIQATAKPTWKSYEDQIGVKYQTWAEAQDAFADDRDAWRETDLRRQQQERQTSEATQAAIQRDLETIKQHQGRMGKALADQTYATVTAEFCDRQIPNALIKAIAQSPNSHEVVLALASNPDVADDLVVLSHGKDPNDEPFVATLQRRLQKHVQAGTTGSAAIAKPVTSAPRPPNPVRTGPIASGDELPGDESSLAEHEKAFGRKRRR